ncbi:MAG: DDE-type integrase/transposase/recombinase [Nanoarchaeota archaeon]|nr:DDE-type integrase/transposase/recombinase [Nanoarchaeota archaeon]MBU1632600.1 DDE-type integrase/transposase/recombinase [Nanoarchaeota archaeon]
MFICPNCKKSDSAKAGLRKNKSGFVQKYFCKSCNKYFIKRNGFENMKTKPEIIIDALDLRAKGLSFGKIKDFIWQKYKVKVGRSNILYWQNKFGEMINNFTKSFQLSHSFNLHADEIFFRAKGQRERNFVYYWDAIDYDTKFLVADHISLEREELEAKKFMHNIKERIIENPKFIHTDNSYDYPPAIRKTFGRGKVKHIHFPAWKHKFKNNAIERYHNTIRENYKVMRRFQNERTALSFLRFFRNYYNFLRPHKSLNWQTPAEIAGFGKFNWWSLIKIKNLLHWN